MRETLHEIICALSDARSGGCESDIDAAWLDKLVRRRNREMHDAERRVAKKRLLPAYLRMRESEPETLQEWGVDTQIDSAIVKLLKAKPRRTASGVATVTVLTKPWPCASDCLYCPNDVRMPKSYLADEPACQRAERNFFDPYLQVTSRLRVLEDMGHITDKVELIVLGGTFGDYPSGYQIWFISELFRALNDAGNAQDRIDEYIAAGLMYEADDLARASEETQAQVNAGELSYNEAIREMHGRGSAWDKVSRFQTASIAELIEQQHANETAKHRVVGLVVETRPDAISSASLLRLRRLGCTKIQMGVQSLSQQILDMNTRGADVSQVVRAFELLRLFGFKSHIHMMVNLPGATPQSDEQEYLQLVSDPRFIPDEVKLYPCALVESSRLMGLFAEGSWRPYCEGELIDVLSADVMVTPPYTRISRMIRDISATDIVAGNKKTNLRQIVEAHVVSAAPGADDGAGPGAEVAAPSASDGSRNVCNADGSSASDSAGPGAGGSAGLGASTASVQEMRVREIATGEVTLDQLRLDHIAYTTTVSTEHFLQWVTPDNGLAGFLRLSVPVPGAIAKLAEEICCESADLPTEADPESAGFGLHEGQAMIREVHVYGKVAALHEQGESAQHVGLGRKLIDAACDIARDAGRSEVNVISSVGTREYYRKLGFVDNGLYQTRSL